MTQLGPNGSAVLSLVLERGLAVGADANVQVQLIAKTDSSPIDLSVYDTYIGAGRHARDEVLTQTDPLTLVVTGTSPLFAISASLTPIAEGGDGLGTDGKLTLHVEGSELEQDTIGTGFFDLFASHTSAPTVQRHLITGRWECTGGTLDPLIPGLP